MAGQIGMAGRGGESRAGGDFLLKRHGTGFEDWVMLEKLRDRISPRTLVLILLGLATAVKTLWAVTSSGTCDPMLFYFFGKAMQHRSMATLYEGGAIYNHTPLTGWLAHQLCNVTHDYYPTFAAILRIACILADVGVVLGLLYVRKLTGKPPYWALCLFAASPVSIMVSGFHGNIDPIMVMFLFFAAVAVLKDKPVLSGVMFALACNIKIVPIMVAPVFIFYWIARGRRAALYFMGTSGTLMLAGASWALVNCPVAFIRNVFGYGSIWGGWGITYWLRQTGIRAFHLMSYADLSVEQNRVITLLKAILLAGVFVLAWRRRKLGGLEFFTTLGAAFTWIFVFMPGSAAQYMVWYAPFLLLLSPEWWAVITTGATIFLARFYHSTSGYNFPWIIALPRTAQDFYWAPATNLPWGGFIALLLCRWAPWFLLEKPPRPVEAAAEPAVEAA